MSDTALILCPDCGLSYGEGAAACPGCGLTEAGAREMIVQQVRERHRPLTEAQVSAAVREMTDELLREIAEMGEDDVDSFLQDENRWPVGEPEGAELRRACFARLAEIGGSR